MYGLKHFKLPSSVESFEAYLTKQYQLDLKLNHDETQIVKRLGRSEIEELKGCLEVFQEIDPTLMNQKGSGEENVKWLITQSEVYHPANLLNILTLFKNSSYLSHVCTFNASMLKPQFQAFTRSVSTLNRIGAHEITVEVFKKLSGKNITEDLISNFFRRFLGVRDEQAYLPLMHIFSRCDCNLGTTQYLADRESFGYFDKEVLNYILNIIQLLQDVKVMNTRGYGGYVGEGTNILRSITLSCPYGGNRTPRNQADLNFYHTLLSKLKQDSLLSEANISKIIQLVNDYGCKSSVLEEMGHFTTLSQSQLDEILKGYSRLPSLPAYGDVDTSESLPAYRP